MILRHVSKHAIRLARGNCPRNICRFDSQHNAIICRQTGLDGPLDRCTLRVLHECPAVPRRSTRFLPNCDSLCLSKHVAHGPKARCCLVYRPFQNVRRNPTDPEIEATAFALFRGLQASTRGVGEGAFSSASKVRKGTLRYRLPPYRHVQLNSNRQRRCARVSTSRHTKACAQTELCASAHIQRMFLPPLLCLTRICSIARRTFSSAHQRTCSDPHERLPPFVRPPHARTHPVSEVSTA